jgi:two-component system chemotaxis response regulator CheB
MRSAAAAFGPAVTGVVLSGTRDDGTAGLLAIKTAGGTAVVQDPKDAVYSAMPQSAIDHVEVDAVLPVAQIGAWLRDTPARHDSETSPQPMATITNSGIGEPAGEGTRYTCPDCGGVLFADEEGTLPRFGCSVGHVFSIESLENAQAAVLESALWAAVRSLEDRADLLQRIAARYKSDELRGRHLRDEARFALERAETIRATIEQPQGSGGPPQSAEPAA